MRKIVIAASLVALAACSNPAPEPETAATEEPVAVTTETVTTLAADGKPSTGKFEVTTAKGEKFTADVKPDGTFAVTGADGTVVDTGKWEQKSPEQYCETSDKPDSKQVCFTEKVDDKGVYTSFNPVTGETSTVVRIEG